MKPGLVLFAALVAVLFLGCQAGRRAHREAAGSVSSGPAGVQVNQTGAAATPATASRKSSRWETLIPAGVEATAWADGRITWRTTAPQPVATTTTEESATGPQSFTPPAAPSPADEADGTARLVAWISIGLGAAAGIFGALRAYPALAVGGGCVAAAGVAVIALGKLPDWIWWLVGAGLFLGLGGPLVWHLVLKHRAAKTAAASPAPLSG